MPLIEEVDIEGESFVCRLITVMMLLSMMIKYTAVNVLKS